MVAGGSEKTRTPVADPLTTLNENAIFGGVEKRVNSKEFRGGQLQSLFGGIELDLRDADIAESPVMTHKRRQATRRVHPNCARPRSGVSDGECLHNQVRDRIGL